MDILRDVESTLKKYAPKREDTIINFEFSIKQIWSDHFNEKKQQQQEQQHQSNIQQKIYCLLNHILFFLLAFYFFIIVIKAMIIQYKFYCQIPMGAFQRQ